MNTLVAKAMEVTTKCGEATHRKQENTMGTLLYRGAEVQSSEKAVAQKPSIASYRGHTYNPQEVEAAPKVTSGQYRGSSWEV
tara:strand:+ start:13 stop:258 length:246 start_codon:yes stop_codon:yes gene_type:complete